MSELRTTTVAPCSVADARRAVLAWHYSRRMPVGRLVCHGVWEAERYVGAIIYGRGASPTLGQKYGLTSLQCCELVRIALAGGRSTPTSSILARSLRLLARDNPGLCLVVSFADPAQGHIGTLYQAANWYFDGATDCSPHYFYRGRWCHVREVCSGAFGKGGAVVGLDALPQRTVPGKLRYTYPLNRRMRALLKERAQPYPRKQSAAIAGQ